MPEPEERFTLHGTKLPPQEGLPPTLLFHRWQRYDCFWPDSFVDGNKVQSLTPFKRDFTSLKFLQRVVSEVQGLTKERYTSWYKSFVAACEAVGAEPPVNATTLWRLVVGWGTNPAFETGITLDHLLGFPFIPGSAVKGLLHRVAELELLEAVGEEPAVPACPPELPKAPTAELERSFARALRVRALFGSIHLKKNPKSETDPEGPFDRLAEWRRRLPVPDAGGDPWKDAREQLARLCSDAPAGGMVTCFDAVPAPETFKGNRNILTPDVLTPHVGDSPNPILFLAVRDGVPFELRYRLTWPAGKPRDAEERERTADLGGIDRETAAKQLRSWLVRGLEELGLGGKASAGYGYLYESQVPPMPTLRTESISESEKFARKHLPEGLSSGDAAVALEKALKDPDRANQAAAAARFKNLHADTLNKWRKSPKDLKKERAKLVDELAEENQKK